MNSLSSLLSEPLPLLDSDSPPKKRKLAVIDCETDPFKKGRFPKPFLWGFYDGSTYEEFKTKNQMLDFFQTYPEPLRVYAHNGGKFDYHFMLEDLEADTQIMIINGRLSKFIIGNVEYRDSYNLFNFPLAAYKKDDMDYAIMEEEEREKPHNKKKISDYLYKDCLYLFELVEGFISQYGLHLTQAGAGIKILQKMYDIKIPASTSDYYDTIKQFYYGGRVECFAKGIIKKHFKMLDITSAYPYAMIHKHPFSLEYKYYNTNQSQLYIKGIENGLMNGKLSNAFFTINARSRGALPWRDKKQDKLAFPNDNLNRKFTVTGWEIQAGIRTGTLSSIKVLDIRIWNELKSYEEYVAKFFKMKDIAKKAKDKLNELFAKLFLNSPYGKFAADPRKYKSFTLAYSEDIQNYLDDGFEEGGFLGEWFLAKKDLQQERQRFYNVATAASITGFVRAYLWEAACKCKGLLYCDTDSIAAHDISQIDLSNDLGGWGLDGEFDYGGIGGRKMYAFRKVQKKDEKNDMKKWKIASKGARLEADEIIKVAKGQKVIYEPQAPTYSFHTEPRFTNREIVKT